MPTKRKKGLLAMIESLEPAWLRAIHFPSWMVLILALIFLFRIPSFFEPFYYGDEMIYLNLGDAIKRGEVLYRDIHDNKPPLLYFTAAVAGNVFWFRAILAGWMMGTTVAFWKLVESMFPGKVRAQQAMIATFSILTTIPLLEGQIANAELFMIGPTIVAFWILLNKNLTTKTLLISGVLLSISTLYKIPAAFDIGAIIFIWMVALKYKKSSITSFVKNSILLAAGFAVPILITFLWYWMQGAFNEYLISGYLQNFGYLSSFRPDDVAKPFLDKNGPLLIRGLIVLGSLLSLWLFRKKLSKQFLFAVAWLLFGLFAVTLSERPYPHYIVQIVPAISILVGILLTGQTIEQSLTVFPLFLVVAAIVRFQFWYYPTISYYQNFVEFFAGAKDRQEYFSYFDGNADRNYKIARFIITSSKPTDSVFVWGDSSTIYAISDRKPAFKYIAGYHIIDFSSKSEVLASLEESEPKLVVVLPGSPPFPELRNYLSNNYIRTESIDNAVIWSRMTPEISELLQI